MLGPCWERDTQTRRHGQPHPEHEGLRTCVYLRHQSSRQTPTWGWREGVGADSWVQRPKPRRTGTPSSKRPPYSA